MIRVDRVSLSIDPEKVVLHALLSSSDRQFWIKFEPNGHHACDPVLSRLAVHMMVSRLIFVSVSHQHYLGGLERLEKVSSELLLYVLYELTAPRQVEFSLRYEWSERVVVLDDIRILLRDSFDAKTLAAALDEMIEGYAISASDVDYALDPQVVNEPIPEIWKVRRRISSGDIPTQMTFGD